jgi:hypothetical protein
MWIWKKKAMRYMMRGHGLKWNENMDINTLVDGLECFGWDRTG